MSGDALEVKTHAATVAFSCDAADAADAPTWQATNTPACILDDFGAAFPSLSLCYLRAVLEVIGDHVEIILAIQQLHVRNCHVWRFGGMAPLAFDI
eukprot:1531600-Pyramimonas_sp.AAC.1